MLRKQAAMSATTINTRGIVTGALKQGQGNKCLARLYSRQEKTLHPGQSAKAGELFWRT